MRSRVKFVHSSVTQRKILNFMMTRKVFASKRKWNGEKRKFQLGLCPSYYLFTPIRLSSSPAAQILLIFGFMHRRVAARHLLRLKRVSLSRAHWIAVRRLLIHLLKLSVLEMLRMMRQIRVRRINCHLSCRPTFKDCWRVSKMINEGSLGSPSETN